MGTTSGSTRPLIDEVVVVVVAVELEVEPLWTNKWSRKDSIEGVARAAEDNIILSKLKVGIVNVEVEVEVEVEMVEMEGVVVVVVGMVVKEEEVIIEKSDVKKLEKKKMKVFFFFFEFCFKRDGKCLRRAVEVVSYFVWEREQQKKEKDPFT